MKNAFYFILKAFFALKIFKFLSQLFGHVRKQLDEKDKVNFEINDVTTWFTNNCNAHIAQYLPNNQTMKFGQLIKCNMRNIFLQKLCR